METNTYEYHFIKVELEQSANIQIPKVNHHEIIDRMAKRGWRLVQIFTPPTAGYWGRVRHFELIFEKPREK